MAVSPNGSNISRAFISPFQSEDIPSSGRQVVVGAYQNFQSELLQMVRDYADRSKPLKVGNVVLEGELKYGPAGTALINFRTSEIESITSHLLSTYRFILNLDKDASTLTRGQ